MYILVAHNWQDVDAASLIAEALGILVFEARQKIAGGGPKVLSSFAQSGPAEAAAARLSEAGVPALVIDTQEVRSRDQSLQVAQFALEPQALRVEFSAGETLVISYDDIALLLVATQSSGQANSIHTETKRKFSIGKTLLAGGVPMTKKVKIETTLTSEERGKTLWIYLREGKTLIFDQALVSFTGLGAAMQISRDLNFTYLENQLRTLAPQAGYDNRLLKRAELARVLGQPLNPATDLDLAFEILARSLREQQTASKLPPQ